MATHSSILAWKIPWTEKPGGPLGCKEIQPVHSKGDQSRMFFGRNDIEAETPILWPPDEKG